MTTSNELAFVAAPHDWLAPLGRGEVGPSSPRITVDHRTSYLQAFHGEGLPATEVSLNRYLILRAQGDDRYVGLPVAVMSGFRHRTWYTLCDSALTDLSQLGGKRVGTNGWPDTGTFWARAAMREAGVEISDVEWTIGDLDKASPMLPASPVDAQPPAGSHRLGDGETLVDELVAGRIDAILTANVVPGVNAGDGPIRRLPIDCQAAERAYFERTGIFPPQHIAAVRRDVAERSPHLVGALFDALRASWERYWQLLELFPGTLPWRVSGLEAAARDFQDFYPPIDSPGFARALPAMCREQEEQGLVERAADPVAAFADFRELVRRRN